MIVSYHYWTTDGFGFCVDDIHTTPKRLMELAAMNKKVLRRVEEYLNEEHPGWTIESLNMEDFNDLEGDCGETGLAYVLYEIINLSVSVALDFGNRHYILYKPSYPWSIPDGEENLTEEDVLRIFRKYISVVTDDDIFIDYQSVENGG